MGAAGWGHLCCPEGVKKLKTGGGWEGEAPPSLMGQGLGGAMARQKARPPNFFTPPSRVNDFHPVGETPVIYNEFSAKPQWREKRKRR